MTAPLVSIVIPVRNGGAWFDIALRSALDQTYEDLEIVVCDNASDDDTLDRARALAREDARISIHPSTSDIGPVANFSRALSLARGAFVKLLMADDVLLRRNIEQLLEPLLGDDTVVLSTARRRRIDADGRPLEDDESTVPVYERPTVVTGVDLGDHALRRCANVIGEPTSVLFRRSALARFNSFGGQSFRVNADVATWLSLLAVGNASYLPEVLSEFRIHAGQDQRTDEFPVLGLVEWMQLLAASRGQGFLRDAADWRSAHRRWLWRAGATVFHSRRVPPALLRLAWPASRAAVVG